MIDYCVLRPCSDGPSYRRLWNIFAHEQIADEIVEDFNDPEKRDYVCYQIQNWIRKEENQKSNKILSSLG